MNLNRLSDFEYSVELEKELWKNCIVVFDTSVLLGFYLYSKTSQVEIFEKILAPIQDRLWLPNHVEFEYLKNRKKSITKPIAQIYDPITVNLLPSIIKDVLSLKNKIQDLQQKTSKENIHPIVGSEVFLPICKAIETLSEEADDFSKNIKLEIKNRVLEIKAVEEKDLVLEYLDSRFEVGDPFSFTKQMEILRESELRFRNEVPPGYEDATGKDAKSGIQRVGDLIIWYQIIEHALNKKLPIIFVTNDVKNDWCYVKKHSNEVRIDRPREELIQEMWDKAKVKFWMYTFPQFLHAVGSVLNLTINESAMNEAELEATNRLEAVSPILKFNGFYINTADDAQYSKILRFFENGDVISVSLSKTGDLNFSMIDTWFNRTWDDKGQYIVSGNTISFFSTSSYGRVNYEGAVLKEYLMLDSESLINGHKSKSKKYIFYEI